MNYSQFVRSRVKSGEKIAAEMTPHKIGLLTLQIDDVVRESGTLDKIKKYTIYNDDKHGCSSWGLPCSSSAFDGVEPTPSQCELLHAAIGIAGEAGELLEAIRNHVFDGKPLDEDNVIEELGDLCFYLEAAMQAIKMNRADIEELNMAKLSERYKDGYSDQQAQERKDKQ
jgi:NTP pyrophosphatase (non-canonical NTP hydrolase)